MHENSLRRIPPTFLNFVFNTFIGAHELTLRCEGRLKNLEVDLELRRRVQVHEVEERKNQHINDLVKNHQKAFGQMKNYYNDITRGNLQLIKSLQQQGRDKKI